MLISIYMTRKRKAAARNEFLNTLNRKIEQGLVVLLNFRERLNVYSDKMHCMPFIYSREMHHVSSGCQEGFKYPN